MTSRKLTLVLLCGLLAGGVLACHAPRAARTPIDWSVAEHDGWSIHILTEDENARPRVTRIWHVVFDRRAAIRTNDSRWWKNIKRGSSVYLRVRGVDYPVAVESVIDPATRERIDGAFAEKYGWQERMIIGRDRAASESHYMLVSAAQP